MSAGRERCARCGKPSPRCPVCLLGPLAIGEIKGIHLDVCDRCSGIWFDGGELEALTGQAKAPAAVQAAATQSLAAPVKRRPKPRPARRPDEIGCCGCNAVLRPDTTTVRDGKLYCQVCASKERFVDGATSTMGGMVLAELASGGIRLLLELLVHLH